MSSRKVLSLTLIIFISNFFLMSTSHSQENRLINFQGRLTDPQGNVLDGSYYIIFSIYASVDDTDPIWTEMHNNVSVSKGLINVLLGSVQSFGNLAC